MDRIKHFMVAFFGYHLQGREDYQQYFSEDFVSQFDDLAWGMVAPLDYLDFYEIKDWKNSLL